MDAWCKSRHIVEEIRRPPLGYAIRKEEATSTMHTELKTYVTHSVRAVVKGLCKNIWPQNVTSAERLSYECTLSMLHICVTISTKSSQDQRTCSSKPTESLYYRTVYIRRTATTPVSPMVFPTASAVFRSLPCHASLIVNASHERHIAAKRPALRQSIILLI